MSLFTFYEAKNHPSTFCFALIVCRWCLKKTLLTETAISASALYFVALGQSGSHPFLMHVYFDTNTVCGSDAAEYF